MRYIDRWLIDAFRCATISKDDGLENELYFINGFKMKLYNERNSTQ